MNARPLVPVFSKWNSLREFFVHPRAAEILLGFLANAGASAGNDNQDTNFEMVLGLPLVKLVSFGQFTDEQVDGIIAQINQAVQV
jgi:hypothetical protein